MLITESKLEDRIEWTVDDPNHGNSLGLKIYQRFHELLSNVEEECRKSIFGPTDQKHQTRLLVIKAKQAGSRNNPIWIAGGNLRELAKLSKEEVRNYAQNYSLLCRRLMELPIPVFFAMDGQVIGGGVELALFGDVRFATAGTTFAFKQLKVGLSLGYGSSGRLVQLLGPGSAMDYMLSQRVLDAGELLAKGLIQKKVTGAAELEEAIAEFSANLAQIEPLAVAMQKRMINRHCLSAKEQLEQDLDDFASLWKNPSHVRFLEQFLKDEPHEKR